MRKLTLAHPNGVTSVVRNTDRLPGMPGANDGMKTGTTGCCLPASGRNDDMRGGVAAPDSPVEGAGSDARALPVRNIRKAASAVEVSCVQA